MELVTVTIEKPDEDVNIILGQSHFIKTVEDLHEALVNTVPGIRFGLAFAEASGPCLVRTSGTDPELRDSAGRNVLALGAGHVFLIMLRGAFPINVLGSIRRVPEVCSIFCATANPCEVILAETAVGRGVLGVVDGSRPLGLEGADDVTARQGFLRKIGYKM